MEYLDFENSTTSIASPSHLSQTFDHEYVSNLIHGDPFLGFVKVDDRIITIILEIAANARVSQVLIRAWMKQEWVLADRRRTSNGQLWPISGDYGLLYC